MERPLGTLKPLETFLYVSSSPSIVNTDILDGQDLWCWYVLDDFVRVCEDELTDRSYGTL